MGGVALGQRFAVRRALCRPPAEGRPRAWLDGRQSVSEIVREILRKHGPLRFWKVSTGSPRPNSCQLTHCTRHEMEGRMIQCNTQNEAVS